MLNVRAQVGRESKTLLTPETSNLPEDFGYLERIDLCDCHERVSLLSDFHRQARVWFNDALDFLVPLLKIQRIKNEAIVEVAARVGPYK